MEVFPKEVEAPSGPPPRCGNCGEPCGPKYYQALFGEETGYLCLPCAYLAVTKEAGRA